MVATIPSSLTLTPPPYKRAPNRELLAADLAVTLRDNGVTRLTQTELATEAARIGVTRRTLTTYLHDVGIRMMPC
jgi:hypothetical protein